MQEPKQISLPTIFGMKTVNSWLLRGNENILIDCGEDTLECRAALEAGLEKENLRFSDIDRVVITHAHVDHIGMAAWLAEEHNIDIWVSDLVEPWAKNAESMWLKREMHLISTIANYLGTSGVQLFMAGYQSMMKRVSEVWRSVPAEKLTIFSHEGNILFNDKIWQVLYLPGHANTQSVFYYESKKWLLSSDMLLKMTPTPVIEPRQNNAPYEPPIVQMLQSYKRLLQFSIDKVYPGHYEVFDNAHDMMISQVERINVRVDDCLSIIKNGVGELHEIYNQMYKGKFFIPAFNMTIAYIDLLEYRGLITKIHTDDRILFSAI